MDNNPHPAASPSDDSPSDFFDDSSPESADEDARNQNDASSPPRSDTYAAWQDPIAQQVKTQLNSFAGDLKKDVFDVVAGIVDSALPGLLAKLTGTLKNQSAFARQNRDVSGMDTVEGSVIDVRDYDTPSPSDTAYPGSGIVIEVAVAVYPAPESLDTPAFVEWQPHYAPALTLDGLRQNVIFQVTVANHSERDQTVVIENIFDGRKVLTMHRPNGEHWNAKTPVRLPPGARQSYYHLAFYLSEQRTYEYVAILYEQEQGRELACRGRASSVVNVI